MRGQKVIIIMLLTTALRTLSLTQIGWICTTLVSEIAFCGTNDACCIFGNLKTEYSQIQNHVSPDGIHFSRIALSIIVLPEINATEDFVNV